MRGRTARTPFEGDIDLADDETAGRALEELLQINAQEAMRDAIVELTRSGATLTVRFRERDRVQLLEVLPMHRTSCILATEQREPETGAPQPVTA